MLCCNVTRRDFDKLRNCRLQNLFYSIKQGTKNIGDGFSGFFIVTFLLAYRAGDRENKAIRICSIYILLTTKENYIDFFFVFLWSGYLFFTIKFWAEQLMGDTSKTLVLVWPCRRSKLNEPWSRFYHNTGKSYGLWILKAIKNVQRYSV